MNSSMKNTIVIAVLIMSTIAVIHLAHAQCGASHAKRCFNSTRATKANHRPNSEVAKRSVGGVIKARSTGGNLAVSKTGLKQKTQSSKVSTQKGGTPVRSVGGVIKPRSKGGNLHVPKGGAEQNCKGIKCTAIGQKKTDG